ncbi:hypothetical protein Tco_1092800 [Tanacetum coccineum]|uniref:Uncharacterized protein n=1 Tax=Tanacetum coccineum TaxID=301880 RepID=A0ABQ5IDB3_9ASTR
MEYGRKWTQTRETCSWAMSKKEEKDDMMLSENDDESSEDESQSDEEEGGSGVNDSFEVEDMLEKEKTRASNDRVSDSFEGGDYVGEGKDDWGVMGEYGEHKVINRVSNEEGTKKNKVAVESHDVNNYYSKNGKRECEKRNARITPFYINKST